MMRIAICDDEEAQRALIEKYLFEWAEAQGLTLETVTFSDAEQFLFDWEEDKRYDLLILDIEMGTINGMDLAKRIRKEDEEIPIVFITGYENYMAQGYEVSAMQYLLKPMYKDKLFTVLDKLKKVKKVETKLPFQTEEGMVFVAPSEIWYVEATGHYSTLHTVEASHLLRHSFSEMLKRLSEQNSYVQCHRSYLVNVQHVSAITKTDLIMDNRVKIPISRNSYKAVNQRFIASYNLHREMLQ